MSAQQHLARLATNRIETIKVGKRVQDSVGRCWFRVRGGTMQSRRSVTINCAPWSCALVRARLSGLRPFVCRSGLARKPFAK